MLKKMNKKGIFSVFLALTLYYLIKTVKKSPALPSISDIMQAGLEIFASSAFYLNILYTIKIVFVGILIAFSVGFIIAVICSLNDNINNLIMPIINSTKNVPSIALFPLFIVLMGIGDAPRIFIIVWNSIYPIISSTFVGLNSPDSEVIDASKNCGASKLETCLLVRIPLATVDILNGLKISIGNGFIAIVVAEMLGATKGLGYMVLWSANAFNYPEMYVYILVIALIGFAFNLIIDTIISFTERKIFYESSKKDFSTNFSGRIYDKYVWLWEHTKKQSESECETAGAEGNTNNEVCRS